jgi:ParB-like chromosome segregation protein Spo0J
MTHPHTAGRAESLVLARVRNQRGLNPIALREQGEALQRKGFTLSEIAERLDLRRAHVANLLYWEKVRDV